MLLIALIESLCLAPFESFQAYLAGLSAAIAPILFYTSGTILSSVAAGSNKEFPLVLYVSLSLSNQSLWELRGNFLICNVMYGIWMMALFVVLPRTLQLPWKSLRKTRGLHVNRSKSLLYIPPEDDPCNNLLPSNIPFSTTGFSLLGVPLGSHMFREQKVFDRVEKIRLALERLRVLADSQVQTTLLRSCLSLPKFNYSLRTCPPSLILNATTLFDNLIREILEDITGGPLSDWSWAKANLPCSRRGDEPSFCCSPCSCCLY